MKKVRNTIIINKEKSGSEMFSDLTGNKESLFDKVLNEIFVTDSVDDLDSIEVAEREAESEELEKLTEKEKEKLESLKELHKGVIIGKKIIGNENSTNANYDKLKVRLDKFYDKSNDLESSEGWAWKEYNSKKEVEIEVNKVLKEVKLEDFYNIELKKVNSIPNRLKRIRLYGSENAELYMLYTRILKKELPEYIEKIKEELGTKFVRFNGKFKKAQGESFGDFVVRKITNVENFYFNSDQVWREIENAKEEVLGQILDIAPTIQYQQYEESNNSEEKAVIKENYYNDEGYEEKGIIYQNKGFPWKISKSTPLAKNILPTRLYNIETKRIERTAEKSDIKNYAIASYVWGAGDLTKDDEKKLSKLKLNEMWGDVGYKNGLNPSGYRALIKAIETCKLLDINYLWMDQLCTNQGDIDDKNEEVPKMRQYYSNSSMTLMSIDGNIRGNDNLLPSLPDTLKKIVGSKWFTRSWTFQEGWLSKQTVFMFDDELVDGRAVAQAWVLNQPVYTKFARYNSLEEAAKAAKKIATPLGWTYYKGDYDKEDEVTLSLGQVLKEVKNRGRGAPIDGIYSILGLLPYGKDVRVNYKPRICKGGGKCLKSFEIGNYELKEEEKNQWGIEDDKCEHPDKEKKWPSYAKRDIAGALYEVMKAAIKNGYGEPFAWHGESNGLMPEVINERGSTDMIGGLILVCKCEKPHKACEKCENKSQEKHDHDFGCAKIKDVVRDKNDFVSYGNVEVKGSKYILKSAIGEIVGMEGSKGFLIEGGLYKRGVTIEGVGEIILTGSKEALNSIQEKDLLLVLDKDKWESESPFAILVNEDGDNEVYCRKGIVGFDGKSEVRKLEELKIEKENLTIDNEYDTKLQSNAIKEVERELENHGLSERVLGEGWKFSFRGKVKEKIEKEKTKLLKLAEEVKEWFKTLTSLNPSEDYKFVLWLKDEKKLSAKQALENLKQLKEEYSQKLEAKIEVSSSRK